jgi:hypothetical protein
LEGKWGPPLEEILNLPPPPLPNEFWGWRRGEERRGEGDLLVKVNVDY